eukprot:scaffold1534_cov122-Isochrysis_galbana.AAC.8
MMRALCSSVHGKDDLFRCVRGLVEGWRNGRGPGWLFVGSGWEGCGGCIPIAGGVSSSTHAMLMGAAAWPSDGPSKIRPWASPQRVSKEAPAGRWVRNRWGGKSCGVGGAVWRGAGWRRGRLCVHAKLGSAAAHQNEDGDTMGGWMGGSHMWRVCGIAG